MSILHLVRNPDDQRAFATIEAQASETDVTVIYLQDAVYREPIPGVRTFVCALDWQARQPQTTCEQVDYDAIIELIAQHDKVITW